MTMVTAQVSISFDGRDAGPIDPGDPQDAAAHHVTDGSVRKLQNLGRR
jgi:hypothetical protein